jgi:hypothetical protein
VVPVNVDTVCIEMIPFARSRYVKGSQDQVQSMAPFTVKPAHPTYSDEALRSLFIAYNHVWKWLWDPHYVTHGSRVDDIVASAASKSSPSDGCG